MRFRHKPTLKHFRRLGCEVCGASEQCAPDHVKTVGSGGSDVSWNLVSSCTRCHSKRHDGNTKLASLRAIICKREKISTTDLDCLTNFLWRLPARPTAADVLGLFLDMPLTVKARREAERILDLHRIIWRQ